MKKIILILFLLLIIFFALGASCIKEKEEGNETQMPEQDVKLPAGIDPAQIELLVHDKVNEKRAEAGFIDLELDSEYSKVAREVSRQVLDSGEFLSETKIITMLSDADLRYRKMCMGLQLYIQNKTTIAENITSLNNKKIADDVFEDWFSDEDFAEFISYGAWFKAEACQWPKRAGIGTVCKADTCVTTGLYL